MTAPRYLSPSEIAERLGVSRAKVYRMLHDIRRVKLGDRMVRVLESDLEAYLQERTIRPSTAALRDDREPPLPSWARPLKPRNGSRR